MFLTSDGRVKILDFGLAKLTAPGDADRHHHQTTLGTVLGTVGYMAPEQIRGQAAGPQADIFACGAILYELVCGRRPFAGLNAADTMEAILTADPVPLRSLCPDVPGVAVAIVERCMAKDPDARYQSGMELFVAVPAAGFAPTVGEPARVPWRRRRRAWVAAFAISVVIAAILSVVGWWMAGRDDRRASHNPCGVFYRFSLVSTSGASRLPSRWFSSSCSPPLAIRFVSFRSHS